MVDVWLKVQKLKARLKAQMFIVCVSVCACVHMCAEARGHLRYHLSDIITLFFETESLPVSTSQHWESYAHSTAWHLAFHVGSGD